MADLSVLMPVSNERGRKRAVQSVPKETDLPAYLMTRPRVQSIPITYRARSRAEG